VYDILNAAGVCLERSTSDATLSRPVPRGSGFDRLLLCAADILLGPPRPLGPPTCVARCGRPPVPISPRQSIQLLDHLILELHDGPRPLAPTYKDFALMHAPLLHQRWWTAFRRFCRTTVNLSAARSRRLLKDMGMALPRDIRDRVNGYMLRLNTASIWSTRLHSTIDYFDREFLHHPDMLGP
jgi:hypothetical protein